MRAFLILALLTACSSPGLRYQGTTPTRAEVNGWVIDVYRRGDRAQAIRLNRMVLPKAEDMFVNGGIAIERATRCRSISKRKMWWRSRI